jgi:predicted DNA binding protein
MGYFAYPKRANAEAVAAELDIDSSTFAEHIAAAQDKLLTAVLS